MGFPLTVSEYSVHIYVCVCVCVNVCLFCSLGLLENACTCLERGVFVLLSELVQFVCRYVYVCVYVFNFV